MRRGFQRHRLTVRSQKTLATASLLLTLLVVPMIAGRASAGGTDESQNRFKLAPLLNEKAPNRIANQYIVVFKPGTSRNVFLAAQNETKRLRSTVRITYETSGLIGFSAELSKSALQTLRANPSVAYIEVDQVGSLNTIQTLAPDPNWPKGLDRVSERFLPLDNKYTYSESGAGVHVYVIDTGIHAGHTEFGGRVSGGTNTMPAADGTGDCHGHGTHVAGIIGGETVGIAKKVFLHPVRAGDCSNTTLSAVIKAVNWVTDNRIPPAVVNLSTTFEISTTLENAVTNSINSGVTYVVAAGNIDVPACNFSPARMPRAITVGAINPTNDTRMNESVVVNGVSVYWISNYGTCLDIFAPGARILSAMPDVEPIPGCSLVSNTPGSRTQSCSGTSMATAHVTGIVARILSRSLPSSLTPQDVWNALHNANNRAGTLGWGGVGDPGTNSPNEMLHYGSVSDGYNDGDPHITAVNGIHYDFQPGGEFVALRDANGMEIQTRQTPVPGAEHVSINTAIAARVGKHRLTWQPNISGVPDPNGLQLRVDGTLTTIFENGLSLGEGGRVMKSVDANGLEIHFPDGSLLIVTSNWWDSQKQWYLNLRVFHTPATEGIMGAIEQDSWSKPEFAETWRVTNKTSLFDYATGQSTKTFTFPTFPTENIRSITPENEALATHACDGITDKNMLNDCRFDVAVTGDQIFGKSARIQQQIQRGATSITVNEDKYLTRIGEQVTFTATVARHERGDLIPTGEVIFLLDGKPIGTPLRLDSSGRARWKTQHIMVGEHRVAARYIPDKDSLFLSSRSIDEQHTVKKRGPLRKPIPERLDRR